jgi:phosphoglycerol transferase MdoB-like AlkP superfamily enzyme
VYSFHKGAGTLLSKLNYSTRYNSKDKLKQNLMSLLYNKAFYFTLLRLFIKSVMFIWLINSNKGTRFEFGWAFYGDAHIFVYLSFIAMFISFAFLLKKRAHMWVLIGINLIITILIIGDLWYYRGFNSFLSLHVLDQTTNLDNLTSDIISMMRPIDLIFLIDLLVAVPLVIKLKNIYRNQRSMPSVFFIMLFLSASIIGLSHYKIDILEKGEKSILFRICWTPNQTIANLSPIGYHIYDSYNYWVDNKPYNLKDEDKQEIEAWFDENMLKTAQWISEYYMCTLAEAMRLFIPGKSGIKTDKYYFIKQEILINEVVAFLADKPGELHLLWTFIQENGPVKASLLTKKFGKSTDKILHELLERHFISAVRFYLPVLNKAP